MAHLNIRVDNGTYALLHARSTAHHISMEEEVRQIITQAVSAPQRISDIFSAHFGEKNGITLHLDRSERNIHSPIALTE